MSLERAAFWDRKILPWERARYSAAAAANPFAWTVRARLREAARLLDGEAETLELGCGTGRLAAATDGPGRRYVGVDFSEAAIAAARARFAGAGDRVRFERADAVAFPAASAGICVFLGLLDWLPGDEPRKLFEARREPRLLFSFTETGGRFSALYERYRRRADPAGCRARSFSEEEVLAPLEAAGYRADALVRGLRLGPGALVLASRR